MCKRTRSAQSPAKPVKNAPSKRSRRAVSPPNAEDTDEDFMTPPPVCKRTRSAAVERPNDSEAVILSNKRAMQKPSKFRTPVQKLQPARFSYVVEARKILELVTSPAFRKKHSQLVLVSLVFYLAYCCSYFRLLSCGFICVPNPLHTRFFCACPRYSCTGILSKSTL